MAIDTAWEMPLGRLTCIATYRQVSLSGIQFLDSRYTVTKIPRYSVLSRYSGWGYDIIIKAAMAPRMYTWQQNHC